jgi:hypothetical protein
MSASALSSRLIEFPTILGIESMALVYAARRHDKVVLTTQLYEQHLRQELFGRIHLFLQLIKDPEQLSTVNDLITKQYGGKPDQVNTLLTELATFPSVCAAIKLLREIGRIPHHSL